MKKNIIRIILLVLLICTFARIFSFSNQDGKESSGVSRKVTEAVTKNVKRIQKMEPHEKELTLSHIEKIIRKCAHFSIYTLVGILMMLLMSTYNLKQKTRILTSILVGAIYASSDELHQYFIPGRTPLITDVIIDTSGVCVGICIAIIVLYILKKVKKRQNKQENDKFTENLTNV